MIPSHGGECKDNEGSFAPPLEASSKLERILECVFFAINRLAFLAIANAIARKNKPLSI
ncbi:MAG: hypothetical protein LBP62_03015 [Clostridiales bacterium]|nr:hypothetical protein [Clostridiales bacterium]